MAPFYPNQVEAISEDVEPYKLLVLLDLIPVGRAREIQFAVKEIKNYMENVNPH